MAGTTVVQRRTSDNRVWIVRLATTALASFWLALVYAHVSASQDATQTDKSGTLPSMGISDKIPAVLTISVSRSERLVAQGSGFLISPEGESVTNVHVLREGDRAAVETEDSACAIV